MKAQLSSETPPMVALIWSTFGQYHVARAVALASRVSLSTVEYGRYCEFSGWHSDTSALPRHATLCSGSVESLGNFTVAARLWQTLSHLQPSAVLVPGYATVPAIAAGLWARFHGRAGILMADSQERDWPRTKVTEWAKSILVRLLFSAAVAAGTRSAAYLKRLGLHPDKIGRYYDVVDNRFFMEQAARLRALRPGGDAVGRAFLFVGRLAPEKNVAGLLRAFAAYRRRGGRWTLRIVGRGPLESSLRSEAAALCVSEAVVFAGFHEGESLVDQYISGDCLVLPSLRDSWGLVVNEAMCCGLPVLVSERCGCAPDLVKAGVNGCTFDPTDVGRLAELLFEMSNRSNAERLAMGRQSLTIVNEFTPEAWAAEAVRLCVICQRRANTR